MKVGIVDGYLRTSDAVFIVSNISQAVNDKNILLSATAVEPIARRIQLDASVNVSFILTQIDVRKLVLDRRAHMTQFSKVDVQSRIFPRTRRIGTSMPNYPGYPFFILDFTNSMKEASHSGADHQYRTPNPNITKVSQT